MLQPLWLELLNLVRWPTLTNRWILADDLVPRIIDFHSLLLLTVLFHFTSFYIVPVAFWPYADTKPLNAEKQNLTQSYQYQTINMQPTRPQRGGAPQPKVSHTCYIHNPTVWPSSAISVMLLDNNQASPQPYLRGWVRGPLLMTCRLLRAFSSY